MQRPVQGKSNLRSDLTPFGSPPSFAHAGKSRSRAWPLWLAVLASSVLYVSAHAPWSLRALAFVATMPVTAALLGGARVPVARAALAGALFGASATWLLVGHWSWLAAREFFAGSPVGAAAFVAGLPLLASGIALHYAAAFALLSRLSGGGAAAGVFGSAAIWSLAELARTSLGYGNPWGSFASALASGDADAFGATPGISALLALGGPVVVAFVASGVGASIGLAWARRRRRAEAGRALAAGLVVLAVAIAATRVDPSPAIRTEAALAPLRVAIVQPGVGGSGLWQGAGAAESLARLTELSRRAGAGVADLVVWPESALPFLLDANVARRDEVRELAKSLDTAILAGGSRAVRAGAKSLVFNSVFLFPADGGLPVAYDKRFLLPFLERVPWWSAPFLQSRWQGAYSPGSSAGDSDPPFVSVASPDTLDVKGWRIAPLLCFEAIYPDVTAARVARGADLLVNLSNDSWFDAGSGVQQHFALARLAAAETRRPLVRAATTGVSALVSESGELAVLMPLREPGFTVVTVAPPVRDSLFVRGGRPGCALLVMLVAAGALAAAARRRKERRAGEQTVS